MKPSVGGAIARLEERITAVRERADRLDTKLDGFPQVYALRTEIDRVSVALETMRADHVQRAEFDAVRDAVRDEVSSGRGRRTVLIGVTGALLLLLSLLFGLLESQRLTSSDVSAQIVRESPWLNDKPAVEHRLTQLETTNQTLRIQLQALTSQVNAIQALDRFFCRTRTPKLSGC